MQRLREDTCHHMADSASNFSGRQIAGFNQQHRFSVTNEGSVALDLVNQAAEVIRDLEDRAAEREARAEAIGELARQVVERAEQRIRVAEEQVVATAARAEALGELAHQSIERAKHRISEIETMLRAAEDRAKIAEAQAKEAKAALIAVQNAIRNKVLNKPRDNSGIWSEAA
jgi:hypothetical protein